MISLIKKKTNKNIKQVGKYKDLFWNKKYTIQFCLLKKENSSSMVVVEIHFKKVPQIRILISPLEMEQIFVEKKKT